MVLAYHVIFTAYGFWLPNDPRGSWSDFVWAWEISRSGAATKVNNRRSVAAAIHDNKSRWAAKSALIRSPLQFTGVQARAIGRGFDDARRIGGYSILACAILPSHVHAVIERHGDREIEMIVSHLKARASYFLADECVHPFQNAVGWRGRRPSPWSESFWQVYLNSAADIRRAITYVNANPSKEGLRQQHWRFVESADRLAPALGPGIVPVEHRS